MLQKQLFWFTNYKSVIFHFTLSFCSPLSFSPLCLPFVSPVVSPRCVSPWCLPGVSPRGGDPNATSRGERFHGGGLWTHQSYPTRHQSCPKTGGKTSRLGIALMSFLVVLPYLCGIFNPWGRISVSGNQDAFLGHRFSQCHQACPFWDIYEKWRNHLPKLPRFAQNLTGCKCTTSRWRNSHSYLPAHIHHHQPNQNMPHQSELSQDRRQNHQEKHQSYPSLILANEWELSHLCPKKAAWCWEKKYGETPAQKIAKNIPFFWT